jgi:hypothetical protein
VIDMAATVAPATGKCRLTLTIDGADYVVRPGDRGDARVAWDLRKKSDGTTYHARQDRWGQCTCSCPDAIKRRQGRCKHLRSLHVTGLMIPSFRSREKGRV